MDISGREWNDKIAAWDLCIIGEEIFSIIPMIFTHRLAAGPADDRTGYSDAWCYPDLETALQAAEAWDPALEPEPTAYIKKVAIGMRKGPWTEMALTLPELGAIVAALTGTLQRLPASSQWRSQPSAEADAVFKTIEAIRERFIETDQRLRRQLGIPVD